jgi:hypothetical protein
LPVLSLAVIVDFMTKVTHILNAIEPGDPDAARQLLPLVYDELRKLPAQKLAHEKPDQTLDATALVHEAYLRLVPDQQFDNRGHFFAAAEAMRSILIENGPRKRLPKHGGGRRRIPLDEAHPILESSDDLHFCRWPGSPPRYNSPARPRSSPGPSSPPRSLPPVVCRRPTLRAGGRRGAARSRPRPSWPRCAGASTA